jgi:hypothetical protein
MALPEQPAPRVLKWQLTKADGAHNARDLQVGDHFTPAGYNIDLKVVAITDHTDDFIGHVILEAVDDLDFAWFIWDGAITRGSKR